MSTTELIELIEKLPADKQKEVEDFIGSLIEKTDSLDDKPKLKREFGSLKGFITYMADDFDAPLEEFKDYM
jgi:hypothetical protein